MEEDLLDENGNPFQMCGNDECEYAEDGFYMKDLYYAACPMEQQRTDE